MRDALTAMGHRVSYHEFGGGHDVASWRKDLPESLTRLFALP
jgi:enterochelin esterase-like enzyme